MIVCKYCGSHNIKTYSDSGNPFDRHPEVTVCGDCGRRLSSEGDIMDTMYAEALKQCSEEELAEIMSDPETLGEEKAEKVCPYCGKAELKPYPSLTDPDRMMCHNCGRTVDTPTPIYDPFPDEPEKELTGNEKRYVRLKMHAHAMGVHRIEGLEVPAEDGEYDLSKMNYPLCRFGKFKIECGKVALDDEVSLLTRHPLQTVKKFTAYAPDKTPWEETIEITIKEIWK